MSDQWKTAALGAFGGATIALVIVFVAASAGFFQNRAVTEETIHDYLMAKPEMLQEMSDALHDKQQQAEVDASQRAVDKQGIAKYFDPGVAFVTGPANAKNTVVEFFDYNCPYCRASLPAMKKFYEKHKNDTRFAFIEFPIKGENSVLATRAMLAARQQPGKYLPFHFALMSEENEVDAAMVGRLAAKLGLDVDKLQKDMNDPKIIQEISRVHLLAERSRINGTPTFIFNGKVRPGAVDEALLAEMTKTSKGS
ncbi:MAG TPA: DsbA family protein [Rhizomicrobium sp.]|jgi:protein-disulfide isomerase|nr:DsbA family protein [Rhizomicrobium sp.]